MLRQSREALLQQKTEYTNLGNRKRLSYTETELEKINAILKLFEDMEYKIPPKIIYKDNDGIEFDVNCSEGLLDVLSNLFLYCKDEHSCRLMEDRLVEYLQRSFAKRVVEIEGVGNHNNKIMFTNESGKMIDIYTGEGLYSLYDDIFLSCKEDNACVEKNNEICLVIQQCSASRIRKLTRKR